MNIRVTLCTVMKAVLFTMKQSEMKALIFSIIAVSLIRPIKSTTVLPVIALQVYIFLYFFFLFLLLLLLHVFMFVCLFNCSYLFGFGPDF